MQGKADGYLGQLADYTAIQVFQPAYDGTGGDEPSLRLLRFEHEESLKPWDCVVSSEHILRKYFIIIQFLDPWICNRISNTFKLSWYRHFRNFYCSFNGQKNESS